MRTSASVPKALLCRVAEPIWAWPSVTSNSVAEPTEIMFWMVVSSAGVAMKWMATEMLKMLRSTQLDPGQPALVLQRLPALAPPTHLRSATGAGRPSSSPWAVCPHPVEANRSNEVAAATASAVCMRSLMCMKSPLPRLMNATFRESSRKVRPDRRCAG
jgi:hypothetical protein